jgi:hypothetical protein
MPLALSVCFSDTLMRRPLAGDLGLRDGHRRGQLRDISADVLRSNHFPQRHDLSSVIEITCRGDLNGSQ